MRRAKIARFNFPDKGRDININGTTGDAGRVFAL
jgi:hypothetical protein